MTLEAQEFIRQHIRSVWQLELLIYFKNNLRAMTPTEVSCALQLEQLAVEECIKMFASKNIFALIDNERYLFSPAAVLTKAIEETEKIYCQRRLSVINFIYAEPMH